MDLSDINAILKYTFLVKHVYRLVFLYTPKAAYGLPRNFFLGLGAHPASFQSKSWCWRVNGPGSISETMTDGGLVWKHGLSCPILSPSTRWGWALLAVGGLIMCPLLTFFPSLFHFPFLYQCSLGFLLFLDFPDSRSASQDSQTRTPGWWL